MWLRKGFKVDKGPDLTYKGKKNKEISFQCSISTYSYIVFLHLTPQGEEYTAL